MALILSGGDGGNATITGNSSNITITNATSLIVDGQPVVTSPTSNIVSVTGNITGGNITTVGLVTATGNIIAGNVSTVGLVTATGNITAGNILTSGVVTATGNITAGNLLAGGGFYYANGTPFSSGAAATNINLQQNYGGF